jgi:hypothetical protein
MSERSELLESIASIIRPYRKGEIPEPTPAHVERWIGQFTEENQLIMLREFEHVIKESFIAEEDVKEFLKRLVTSAKLAGENPKEFWSRMNFLNVQKDGASQRVMLKLLGDALDEHLGIDIKKCGSEGGDFIYLDDILCTGNRVGIDIEAWIKNEAPPKCHLHIVLAVTHTSGEYYLRNTRIDKVKQKAEKHGIEVTVWHSLELENTVRWSKNADVYWPVVLPDDPAVQAYAAGGRFPFKPRDTGGKSKMFKSEAGRHIVEVEFLLAGMKIRSHHTSPKDSLKPMGFGGFGIGFGLAFPRLDGHFRKV